MSQSNTPQSQMSNPPPFDQRESPRDALFLLALCQWPGLPDPVRVKVRNISTHGLMAEADFTPHRGQPISFELRNIGWVEGLVAWVEGKRFGVGLVSEIDPKATRSAPAPLEQRIAETPDLIVRRPLAVRLREIPPDPARMRSI